MSLNKISATTAIEDTAPVFAHAENLEQARDTGKCRLPDAGGVLATCLAAELVGRNAALTGVHCREHACDGFVLGCQADGIVETTWNWMASIERL